MHVTLCWLLAQLFTPCMFYRCTGRCTHVSGMQSCLRRWQGTWGPGLALCWAAAVQRTPPGWRLSSRWLWQSAQPAAGWRQVALWRLGCLLPSQQAAGRRWLGVYRARGTRELRFATLGCQHSLQGRPQAAVGSSHRQAGVCMSWRLAAGRPSRLGAAPWLGRRPWSAG